jgi:protein-tyrosine phosphatase
MTEKRGEWMQGMIDIHCHILQGLDDGPRTLQESVEMCKAAIQDGIRTIVATPHTLNGVYQNHRATILSSIQELKSALRRPSAALMPPVPFDGLNDLKILPGADVHFSEKVLDLLEEGKALTIGDRGKYLLLEFPAQGVPYRAEVALFELLTRGITPIISHPERNQEFIRRPQRYGEMIQNGSLGQVTAMSLTGGFGEKVRHLAEKMLNARWIHFIASDAHSLEDRPPVLSEGVRKAEKFVGKEEAHKMVNDYPRAILEGRAPKFPPPAKGL